MAILIDGNDIIGRQLAEACTDGVPAQAMIGSQIGQQILGAGLGGERAIEPRRVLQVGVVKADDLELF